MTIRIQEIVPDELGRYATVPSAFEVRSVLQAEPLDSGLGGIRLREEPVTPAYVKDYDASEEGGPDRWPAQFDVQHWGFFLALDNDRPVGAAAVAFRTTGVHMLEDRPDLAVLWDIRVAPGWRGRGVGAGLFAHAADWARARGCTQLKIETQNVNVPACRFYARQGAELGAIHRYGYAGRPAVAQEVMLLWYLDL